QVAAYLDEREIGSQFVIIATAKQGVDLQKVERAVDEELSRFLNEGPTEKELQRLKTQSYAGFVRGVERIGGFGGKSDILATSQTYFGSPQGYRSRLLNLEQATTADLGETAQAWLSDGVYALEVHPFSAAAPSAAPAADRTQSPEFGAPHELKLPH